MPGPGILVDVHPNEAHTADSALIEIRLVNTGPQKDTFVLTTELPEEWTSFSLNPVTLNAYEERIVTLTVDPDWSTGSSFFTITWAQSISDPGVKTGHSLSIKQRSDKFITQLPMIVK